jgi:oxygen-dependent protoporphyrinogen oxidase
VPASASSPPDVVVVGGGVSGLATAHYLLRRATGTPPRVTVLEGGDRLGGKVLTREVAGVAVDVGPETLAARPPLLELLDELGLADDAVRAAPLGVYIWSRDRLRRLPHGTYLGVPTGLLPLVRSQLLSPVGILHAGLDLVLPARRPHDDVSVAELLRPRFGPQLFDRLIEPLLAGMHAGPPHELSARSAIPEIDALARRRRSIYLALRHKRRTATPAKAPAMLTIEGGLGRLIDGLATSPPPPGVELNARATSVDVIDERLRVCVAGPHGRRVVDADAVVLATPAYTTARMLEASLPQAAAELRTIPYLGVATVTLAYDSGAVRRQLDATGFLVPAVEGRLVVGCTWMSAKWPHFADDTTVIVRALVGRAGDERLAAWDDATLADAVHTELAEMIGVAQPPRGVCVQRWPRALPQYTVGHGARLDRIDATIAKMPGLHLTGAAYRGAGVASCIAAAADTADAVLAGLRAPTRGR